MRVMAISIQQPWAELIIAGLKPVENRKKRSNYTGILLIHASKKYDTHWEERFTSIRAQAEAREYLQKQVIKRFGRIDWQHGMVIGITVMTGCDTVMNSRWCERSGFYYRLAVPYRFSLAIETRGYLGLFGVHLRPDMMATKDWRKVLEYKRTCIDMGLTEEDETNGSTEKVPVAGTDKKLL